MNGFSYENQSTITYLVYSLAEDDTIDSMSLGMLTNNKIAGLAPAIFTQMNVDRFIRYNVSAKITAKQFLTGSVSRKRLVGVLKGIVDGILSAEDYMIDTSSIILDLDYIFVDVTSCEAVLVCLPIIGACQQTTDIGSFIKNIMVNTQFDSTESSDHIAKIFNFLNSSPVFSIEEFRKLLLELDGAAEDQKRVETTPVNKQPVVQTVVPKTPTQDKQPSVQPNHSVPIQSQGTMQQNSLQNQSKQPSVPKGGNTVPPADPQMPVAPEKQISWFYLMQHYNKENAEAYKAQKAAKKAAGKASVPAQAKAQPKQPVVNPGFAVPSQNGNAGFAIPGQTPSVTQTNPQPVAQSTTPPVAQKSAMQPQQPTYVPRQTPQGQAANFGETTVLGGGAIGETTVLTAAQNPNKMIAPHLIRKKNNEKISLNKPVFRVGKERSYVDYFIGDNTAISRSHANFITREGEYFVVDTNSTNHTFVNGAMIQSNVETAITHGDTIRLANEDFEFRLY